MTADTFTAALILAAALAVVGCSRHVEGAAVEQEQRLHCDLIFPAPGPPPRT